MPESVATPPQLATVETPKASLDAFSKLELEGDVRQILEEVVKEEQQQAKPDEKNKVATEKENTTGEPEAQSQSVDSESVDKVFITGENGEQLEAPVEDIVKAALGEEGIGINEEGQILFTVKADGQEFEGDLKQVKKWASHGIHANEVIQKANNSIAQAEASIADTQRLVQTTAETLAMQKVEQLIDLLSRGIDPSTNQPYTDDNMRQGAGVMADKLAKHQLEQRLKALEDSRKQDLTQTNQRLQAQREAQLNNEAKTKIETVFEPFTQYFKVNGKVNEGLFTRFKEAVALRISQIEVPKHRQEIGKEPDIPVSWVEEKTKQVAKEIFKDYQTVLKPQPKIIPSNQKALRPMGKPKVNVQQKPTRSLSWDEEREQIEKELGFKK